MQVGKRYIVTSDEPQSAGLMTGDIVECVDAVERKFKTISSSHENFQMYEDSNIQWIVNDQNLRPYEGEDFPLNSIPVSVHAYGPVLPSVSIKKLSADAVIPQYQTQGASGFDLHAIEDVELQVGETKLIKTGLSFGIPQGFELQVRQRSGLSLKTGLRVANSPGTVDSDYTGEVCIIMQLVSTGDRSIPVQIKKGDRVAQGVVAPVTRVNFQIVEELSETERGAGGFGSTGN